MEVLIKKITKLRTEEMWWLEFSKLPVGDERRKCDPAAWPPSFVDRYARESLLWLKLMNELGVGSSGWVETLAKEQRGPGFSESGPWHDTQW